MTLVALIPTEKSIICDWKVMGITCWGAHCQEWQRREVWFSELTEKDKV